MCCIIEHPSVRRSGDILYVSPNGIGERATQVCQRIEILELVMELIDQIAHIIFEPMRTLASHRVFEYFDTVHHGAHSLEHLLHSFCVVGDIVMIVRGRFFQNASLLKIAARLNHLFSHALHSLLFIFQFKENELGPATWVVRILAYGIDTIGYILTTIDLIWQKSMHAKSKVTSNQFAVAISGSIANGISTIEVIILHDNVIVHLVKAIMECIKAVFLLYQLMPSDHYHIPKNDNESIRGTILS